MFENGIYWVWFYNHDKPFVMKHTDGRWERFQSDDFVDDEIDFLSRPPLRADVPAIATVDVE